MVEECTNKETEYYNTCTAGSMLKKLAATYKPNSWSLEFLGYKLPIVSMQVYKTYQVCVH